ncbi:hypothetical protein DXD29_08255 [Bifidobacterium pseudocatenulatum]|nr:hypothetical protein DXD29_08255 [Bifidobacterium pseudocatenulatum]
MRIRRSQNRLRGIQPITSSTAPSACARSPPCSAATRSRSLDAWRRSRAVGSGAGEAELRAHPLEGVRHAPGVRVHRRIVTVLLARGLPVGGEMPRRGRGVSMFLDVMSLTGERGDLAPVRGGFLLPGGGFGKPLSF